MVKWTKGDTRGAALSAFIALTFLVAMVVKLGWRWGLGGAFVVAIVFVCGTIVGEGGTGALRS